MINPFAVAALSLAVFAAVSGCAGTNYGAGEPAITDARTAGLAGTKWRLVEFQSMDDAQGITRPEDPDGYTMELMADGRAAFRFDCNRGAGGYETATSGDGEIGSLEFSAVATTKALCPPQSMGEKLARDVAYMRSYVWRDGRLFVSLMADGGIYVWEPIPAD